MTAINELTTEQVIQKQKNGAKIIDIRPVDAYNGWRLQNEKRGGHIKGARSLPAKWTNYMDWIEIVEHKGFEPEDELIVYGYHAEEAERVAKLFNKIGYARVNLYHHFLSEWVSGDYPMEHLTNYRNLVPAQWVKQLIDGEKPDEYENSNFKIVHSHYRNRDAYLSGHIPGAIDMDTLALESPETWNRRNPRELKEALEKHGITSDSTVIVYGKFMHPDNDDEFPGSAAGHIGAIRNAFIMMYAGVRDVRVLNGGFQS
ncbi:MAG: sulfurtransferase, partial [Cyclobacteriaceae bacterium]